MRRPEKARQIVGIDEVGRGPLAGPVAVCALAATPRMLLKFRAIKESKQLSPSAREAWFARMQKEEGEELRFAVSFVSAAVIDAKGISAAIRTALSRSLRKLHLAPENVLVLLDGGLRAPKHYPYQQTIIRGDESETVIAMASVIAKVLRDRRMDNEDLRYPAYGFRSHKGYGSRAHMTAIRTYGFSPLHRRSFCTRIVLPRRFRQ